MNSVLCDHCGATVKSMLHTSNFYLFSYHGMANLTGIPGICQPIGYSKANLPISIQWMTSWWREDILFSIAYAVEKHVDIKKADVYFDIS